MEGVLGEHLLEYRRDHCSVIAIESRLELGEPGDGVLEGRVEDGFAGTSLLSPTPAAAALAALILPPEEEAGERAADAELAEP